MKMAQHFVLVHGASHGAWCWYKLRHLLESSGHKVTCLDLTGAGINLTDSDTLRSFLVYDKPLSDFLSSLPEDDKVILVGHSAGGLSLIHAMHEFGKKISLAIFVAAVMSPFGNLEDHDFHEVMMLGSSKFDDGYYDMFDLNYGMGPDKPPTSGTMKKEFQRQMYYHLSPEEDSVLASMLLRPAPFLAFQTAAFPGGGEDVNRVRRVYIKTLHDRMFKLENQDEMIRKWPPSEVMTIESEHCPFFSASKELCNLILKASASHALVYP